MNGSEIILGELKEFKRATVSELKEIKADVRALQSFKWRVAGGAAVLSVVISAVLEIVHMKYGFG